MPNSTDIFAKRLELKDELSAILVAQEVKSPSLQAWVNDAKCEGMNADIVRQLDRERLPGGRIPAVKEVRISQAFEKVASGRDKTLAQNIAESLLYRTNCCRPSTVNDEHLIEVIELTEEKCGRDVKVIHTLLSKAVREIKKQVIAMR